MEDTEQTVPAEPILEPAFPQPRPTKPVQHRLDSEELAERYRKSRDQELAEAISGDPGLAQVQRAAEEAQAQSRREAGLPEPGEEEDPDTPEAPEDEAEEEEPKPLPDAAQSGGAREILVDGEHGKMIRLLVDGKEQLVSLEDARTRLQKNEAADRRFADVAARRRELDTREQQLAERERALQSRSDQAPPAQGAPDLEEEARSIIKNVLDGEEDQAAQALAKVIQGIRGQSVDPAEIERRVRDSVRKDEEAREQARMGEQAVLDFRAAYPEIAADPALFDYADKQSELLIVENPGLTMGQIFQEAGKRTRAWVESLRGPRDPKPDPLPTPPADPRRDRKQQLVPMPRQASARAQRAQEPEGPETPEQIVAKYRAARNQL